MPGADVNEPVVGAVRDLASEVVHTEAIVGAAACVVSGTALAYALTSWLAHRTVAGSAAGRWATLLAHAVIVWVGGRSALTVLGVPESAITLLEVAALAVVGGGAMLAGVVAVSYRDARPRGVAGRSVRREPRSTRPAPS